MPNEAQRADHGERGPVFITGQHRSGTTLMHVILANHPSLGLAPQDRDWWTRIYPRYQRVRSRRRWNAFVHELFAAYKTHTLELDLAALRPQVERLRPGDFGRAFELLLAAHATKVGKPRWGEKTPFSYRFHQAILRAYPQAQVVHMIRDPRDVCASARYAGFTQGLHHWLTTSPTFTTLEWRRSAGVARRASRELPDRYLSVRYEDLVRHPEETVRRVCEFLGEPVMPGLLDLSKFPMAGRVSNSSFEELGGISTASVGRAANRLRPDEIRVCELLGGRRLAEEGYEGWNVPLGLRGWLRLLLWQPWIVAGQAAFYWSLSMARRLAPELTERRAVFAETVGRPPGGGATKAPQSA